MIDPISILSEAQDLVRKVDHALKSDVAKRLCCDVESLIQSICMLEVAERVEEKRVEHRHD